MKTTGKKTIPFKKMEKDPSYWPYEFIGVPLGINIFDIQKLSKKELSDIAKSLNNGRIQLKKKEN